MTIIHWLFLRSDRKSALFLIPLVVDVAIFLYLALKGPAILEFLWVAIPVVGVLVDRFTLNHQNLGNAIARPSDVGRLRMGRLHTRKKRGTEAQRLFASRSELLHTAAARHSLKLTAVWDCLIQIEISAAGTTYFEPGGVSFWDRPIQKEKPAGAGTPTGCGSQCHVPVRDFETINPARLRFGYRFNRRR
jgi:hypothetical protein